MKKILVSIGICLLAVSAIAQNQTTTIVPPDTVEKVSYIAPPVVMEMAFNKMFPGAAIALWAMDTPENPVVSFKYQDKNMRALFAEDGSLIWKETDLKSTEFPAKANDYFMNVFKDGEIVRYYKFEGTKSMDFECDVKKGGHLYWFQFNADGEILSRRVKS